MPKLPLINSLLASVLSLAFFHATSAAAPQHWTLAWSDEFNGPAMSLPDASKWTFDAGHGGFGNNEDETYCAGESNASPCSATHPNVYLDGQGHLIIEAMKSGDAWTSGRINTRGKEEIQFGRIEARMQLPQGAGVWPAFWLLGANIATVEWPACGELDIMENVPLLGASKVQATVHGPVSQGKGVGLPFTLPQPEQVDTGFHTYGIIWSKDQAQFYVDDPAKPFFTVHKSTVSAGDWVYNHPFFIILNLAIGGNWPGHPDASTPNPATMKVDYVRVYKRQR